MISAIFIRLLLCKIWPGEFLVINPLYTGKLQFIFSAPQLSIFDPELLFEKQKIHPEGWIDTLTNFCIDFFFERRLDFFHVACDFFVSQAIFWILEGQAVCHRFHSDTQFFT